MIIPCAKMYPLVFWGAAIVFFLAKIINLHNKDKQGLWVEISSQVENGKRPMLQFALKLTSRQAFLLSPVLGSSLLAYWTHTVNK